MSRSVLITGGTGALGEAVTRRFLGDGHKVAVTWIVQEEADRLRDSLASESSQPALVSADVTDPDSIASAVEEIAQQQGSIEVLVHLVGGWKGGEPVHEHSIATWDKMMQLNLRSAFLCSRAVLPKMLENAWGRIVLVSARTARVGRTGQAAYAIAKAGVGLLAEIVAEETRGSGVTANAIAPSSLDTPANRRSMPNADHTAWVPTDLAAASIFFLASEEAGQLRGAWLPVFGSV